jgi:hypothetical protein
VGRFHKLSFSKLIACEFTRKGAWPELFARIISVSRDRFHTRQSAPGPILMPLPVQLIFKYLLGKMELCRFARRFLWNRWFHESKFPIAIFVFTD